MPNPGDEWAAGEIPEEPMPDEKALTPQTALDEFEKYCIETSGDWSDFDGRTLWDLWAQCDAIVRPALAKSEADHKRIEAMEAVCRDVALAIGDRTHGAMWSECNEWRETLERAAALAQEKPR